MHRKPLMFVGVLALLVGLGVALDARIRDSAAKSALSAPLPGPRGAIASETPPSPPPQPGLLAATLRDLRLVTVRVEHQVSASAASESWRGDVQASVSAAAVTLFGVDLTALTEDDIRVNALTGRVRLRVTRPARIATEITTPASMQQTQVNVGWGRLRDVAGEYYLGLARARLHEAARAQALSPMQIAEVESLSREQVSRLVRAILGPGHDVEVEFRPDEAAPGAPTRESP